MSNYDELYPKQKHTLKEVSAVFGPNSNGTKAQEFEKTSPSEYAEMRKEAVVYGLVADKPWYSKEKYVPPSKERVLSSEEERIRSRYSKQDVKDFYNSHDKKDNPGNLAKSTDPADQERLRDMHSAGVAYGLFDERLAPVAMPAPVVDESFPLDKRIAAEANLPEGFRCRDLTHFGEILQNIRSAKEARAAAEKAAADRLEADRQNDAAVSSYGRPVTIAQAQALKKIEVKIG